MKERTNQERRLHAARLLRAYAKITGQDPKCNTVYDWVTDIMTDIRHLLFQHGQGDIRFHDLVRLSYQHWRREEKEGGAK